MNNEIPINILCMGLKPLFLTATIPLVLIPALTVGTRIADKIAFVDNCPHGLQKLKPQEHKCDSAQLFLMRARQKTFPRHSLFKEKEFISKTREGAPGALPPIQRPDRNYLLSSPGGGAIGLAAPPRPAPRFGGCQPSFEGPFWKKKESLLKGPVAYIAFAWPKILPALSVSS